MSKVTEKQQRFVINLINGMTQKEAYQDVYEKSKTWTNKTVTARANKLFKQENVQEYYNELLQEQQDKLLEESNYNKNNAIADMVHLKNMCLEDLETKGITATSVNGVIKATETLSKLLGLYSTESKSLDINMTTENTEIDQWITTLSMDQLILLAGDYEEDLTEDSTSTLDTSFNDSNSTGDN